MLNGSGGTCATWVSSTDCVKKGAEMPNVQLGATAPKGAPGPAEWLPPRGLLAGPGRLDSCKSERLVDCSSFINLYATGFGWRGCTHAAVSAAFSWNTLIEEVHSISHIRRPELPLSVP